MLVDIPALTFRREDYPHARDEDIDSLKESMSILAPHRLRTGMYQLCHWNPERCTFDATLTNNEPGLWPRQLTQYELNLPKCDVDTITQGLMRSMFENDRRNRKKMQRYYSQTYKKNWPGPVEYGVCDYPEQVIERWPHLQADDVPRIITFVQLRRVDEPPSGGWRYHKWGPYIGRQRPKSEYLYHDTHIDEVWTYHVYRVVD